MDDANRTTKLLFTPEDFLRASAESEKLSRKLDITNADHIALWLDTHRSYGASTGYISVAIVEAHEAALSALDLPARDAANVAKGMEMAAGLSDVQRHALLNNVEWRGSGLTQFAVVLGMDAAFPPMLATMLTLHWDKLTPLGLAVRTILQEQQT